MRRMKRVLIDQDGVLADTMGRAFEVIKHESGIELCHADVTDYWFKGMQIEPSVFIEIFRREGFYRNLDVITGAVGAIRRLQRDFEVVVCSAPISGAEHCEEDKRLWLAEMFDTAFADSAIITADKHSVEGDLIIEDNPHVDEKPAMWKPIMFSQRWNAHRTDLPRMQGWHDLEVVYRELDKITSISANTITPYQAGLQRQAEIVRLTQHVVQQIIAENPYQPQYQFEDMAYRIEEANGLPDGITAHDLICNYFEFRRDGMCR